MTEAVLSELQPMRVVRSDVGRIGDVLDGLPGGELPSDGADVGSLIGEVVAAERRLAELRLRLMRTAEVEAEHAEVAASGADAWLAALTGSSRAVMAGGLWLARLLEERYPLVRRVFAAGDLSEDQVRIIVNTAEAIPSEVSPVARDAAVAGLVERAVDEGLEPGRLRRVARRMLDRVSRDAADRHQQVLVEAEERRARHQTWMSVHDNGDGTWSGRFVISEAHAHLLVGRLDQLSSPRRLSRNRAGESVVDESAEQLSRDEHLGIAFSELIEHLPADGLANHGRVGATVMVHLDYDRLLDGLGAARLDSGTDLSVGQVRRLACGAGLIPAVFGGGSLPLDLGREVRLHSKAQRCALSAVHDECAAEGCRRPFAWCEIHHPQPWSQGGRTDLANAVPLCSWHHHRIHDPAYTATVLPTGELRFRRRPQPDWGDRSPEQYQRAGITYHPGERVSLPAPRSQPVVPRQRAPGLRC